MNPPLSVEAAVAQAEALVAGGRIADGLAMAEAIWQRLEPGRETLAQADCQRVMAVANVTSGRLTQALVCGYRALELYEQIGAAEGASRMLSLQAVTLARHGDPAAALALVQRAVQMLPGVRNPAAAARVWNNLSVTYEAMGEIGQAIDALERALPLARQIDAPDLMAVCLCNLWLYRLTRAMAAPRDLAQVEPALQELTRQMAEHEVQGRHHLVCNLADGTGAALAELGRLDEARAVLLQGLRAARQVGVGPDQARLVLVLATVDRRAGHFDAAHEQLTHALAMAEQGDMKSVVIQCHLEHSQLHEDQGQWREALECFKRHAFAQQAVLKAQAETAAQVVTVRIEAERARHESRQLHLRNSELEKGLRELASEAEQLAHDAQIDPLTGLGNRRSFHRRHALIEAEAKRHGRAPVTVLIADIDHFKRINDTWSHALGDEVLREIGALLQSHCRPFDVVARFGGEEFVIAFGGGADPTQTLAAAERLRHSIATHDWAGLQAGLAVTISMGITQALPGEPVETTLQRADKALYAAKHAGRNRICSG